MAEGKITRRGGGVNVKDATATENDVLQGETFYSVNKDKKTGNIPSKGAQTFTPSTSNQTISSGQYLTGTQTILGDSDLVPDNIKDGTTIFNVTGTLEEQVAPTYIAATGGSTTTYQENGINYKEHTFTSSSTFTVTQLSNEPIKNKIDYFIVGGGGGGSSDRGAGGGGGYTKNGFVFASTTNYGVTVGGGGSSGSVLGGNGSSTSFGSISVNGGHGGQSIDNYNKPPIGGFGGNGGGSGNGGNSSQNQGGGSDGSNGLGNLPPLTYNTNTSNLSFSVAGYGQGTTTRKYGLPTGTLYAGGGGGGGFASGSNTSGGAGGGGNGGKGQIGANATSGQTNTGGGGGGGGNGGNGGNGGSGIVIIRYEVA